MKTTDDVEFYPKNISIPPTTAANKGEVEYRLDFSMGWDGNVSKHYIILTKDERAAVRQAIETAVHRFSEELRQGLMRSATH
ncbi:MAG: hypothetical protein QOH41_4194 [Blastocatellia bacterium]|jgi:hypothetical protein|nr:hypothetical protein [Blastocatellia bacterium]